MTRISRNLAVTGCALAIGGLLTGCTPDEPTTEPSTSPTAMTTATTSPSPSDAVVAVPPERPAAMDDNGPDGAAAAASYFFELDTYAQLTGDTAALASMSHDTCVTCTARIEQAHEIAANGDTFHGGAVTLQVTETYAQDPATGIWPLDVQLSEAETTITRSDGTVAYEGPASIHTKRVELAIRDGHWVMFAIAQLPEE